MAATKKVTIIFPPGDILTSVVWEKEKDTKLVDLLARLCQLRGLALDSLKARNDAGKKIKEPAMQQTIEQSGLVFVELVEKTKKKAKVKQVLEVDDALPSYPKGVKIVTGTTCDLPIKDQLFDKEWETLQSFKSKNTTLCANFNDEFIVSCLFARKFDLDRTKKLLENNEKFRKDKGIVTIPKFSELDSRLLNPYFVAFGTRTKNGQGIIYMKPKENIPGQEPFTIANIPKMAYWMHFVSVFLMDGIDIKRNGSCVIVDMQDLTWKNFDLEYSRAQSEMVTDVFPFLPKKILVVNAPLMFYGLQKISQTLWKEKMTERVAITEVKDLTKYIDKDQLITEYGGNFNYTREQFLKEISAWCAKHETRLCGPARN